MISKREVREWLDTLPDDAEIGIDEDGLDLQVRGSESYLFVGDLPDEEEIAEANAFLERIQAAGLRRKGIEAAGTRIMS